MDNILLTGGHGHLGKELIKHFDLLATPTHEQLDITKPLKRQNFDLIIHAAAYTKVAAAETKKGQKECQRVNVDGTLNLLKTYIGIPFVFISSEYAIRPVNFYSETKTVGEMLTMAWGRPYLIIRTLFKPRPYPFDVAFGDQYTRGDYVDVIAKLIAGAIKKWDRKTSKIIHVGTKRKTLYELARQTKPDVKMNSIKDITEVRIPADYL